METKQSNNNLINNPVSKIAQTVTLQIANQIKIRLMCKIQNNKLKKKRKLVGSRSMKGFRN